MVQKEELTHKQAQGKGHFKHRKNSLSLFTQTLKNAQYKQYTVYIRDQI